MVKSSDAVSEPSTTTAAADRSSAAVMKRPDSTLRFRMASQLGWVPTRLVVQLVVPAVSDVDVLVAAATALMSGAVVLEVRASASAWVSVDAEP